MNIQTFAYERSEMTLDRQRNGLEKLFNLILNDIEHFEGLIESILEAASNDEEYDMFGTEGANI